MFRVVAVDDEAIVRIAIQNMIEWEKYDMMLVGMASNGKRALELVAEKQPDIVITDLVMNEMDGIELIRSLKKSGYRGRVIVLSNYSEFEMVREAMKVGAFDYILKDALIRVNLLEVLEAAKKELTESGERTAHDAEVLESATYGGLTKHLRRYLLGDSYDRDLLEKNFTGKYCMLLLSSRDVWDVKESAGENFVFHIVEEVLGEKLFLCAVHIGNGKEVILCGRDILDSLFLLEKMLASIKIYTNGQYCMYVSDEFSGYQDMRDVFCKLRILEKHAYYQEQAPEILLLWEVWQEDRKFGRELRLDIKEKLYRAVNSANEEALEAALEEIREYCQKYHIDPDLLKKWLEVGISQTVDVLEGMDSLRSEERSSWYLRLQNAVSLSQTMALLKEICIFLHENTEQKKTMSEVKMVLEYIEEHYREKLTLDALAGYVNFSPSYLARVFKKEVGKTISDYINEYKINKAAELLTYQNMLIKEAASYIGIYDQYYFSKLFKKYKGETPSQFYNRIHNG